MSFLGKLFSKKADAPKPAETIPARVDLRNDPDFIRVLDKYGRELFITKDQWRTNVLPGTLKSHWENADELYATILSALNDGFAGDVLEAAEHLYRIDPMPSRGACIYGIVLMKNNRLEKAESLLLEHLRRHGDDGAVVTNLAKVYAAQNRTKLSDDTLWHALEVDPNQDNGLGWYEAICRERDGEKGGLEALRRIAAIPGSWLAQAWLARASLKAGKLDEALAYYAQSLSRVGDDVPVDLLMQISGDLGNQGHLQEILRIVEPLFVIEKHGLRVGNNLIKAHLDLGHIDEARKILDRLFALNRIDWKETLGYWDTAIAKARIVVNPVESQTPLKVVMLVGEGPVWLKPSSPAAALFDTNRPDAPTLAFLGSSAEIANPPRHVEQQLADPLGRLSRALPLFLAEQAALATVANARTLIPWVDQGDGGFVFSGMRWEDEEAIAHATRDQTRVDHVITTHLIANVEPWSIEVRLLRVADKKCIGNLQASFDIGKLGESIPALARKTLALIAGNTDVKAAPPPPAYQLPGPSHFPDYLLRLEQLLAVRCSALDGIRPTFLSGEREIVDGNILLCAALPGNITTRLLLAQTVLAMKSVRPDIVKEFSGKLGMLQKEHPLKGEAQIIVQRMLDEALA